LEKLEFECRKCGKVVTAEQYKLSPFCPSPGCGTLLHVRPRPKHWLFQFNPSVYKWFDRIKDTQEPEQWLISQHVRLIHKGDLVAIWGSGQKAGIYALGQVITNPAKNPLNPNQEKYFLDRDSISKFQAHYSAFVEYSKVCLEKPVLQEECSRDNVLLNMQILMKQQGTNFRLTFEQWTRISELTSN
jgi:hypothetical protein